MPGGQGSSRIIPHASRFPTNPRSGGWKCVQSFNSPSDWGDVTVGEGGQTPCRSRKCSSSDAQSCPTLCDPWTAARQAPLSMGLTRQGHWSGSPFPPPGDLPDPGIEPAPPASPVLQVDSLPLSHLGSPPGKRITQRKGWPRALPKVCKSLALHPPTHTTTNHATDVHGSYTP